MDLDGSSRRTRRFPSTRYVCTRPDAAGLQSDALVRDGNRLQFSDAARESPGYLAYHISPPRHDRRREYGDSELQYELQKRSRNNLSGYNGNPDGDDGAYVPFEACGQ